MHFTIATASIAALATLFSGTAAQVSGCTGSGPTFTVSNFQNQGFGGVTLGPRSNFLNIHGNGQQCLVNRAPSTSVSVSGDQIGNGIAAIISRCCAGITQCRGGQFKITANSGNVIDMSIQAVGQDCSV
ncbi:hypothetical protein GQ44DRAFT_820080 [Phaeosphaeriaceae sp. PMI808]|nr:hypothetical protein GQ44DRAFT_820080 [Phaeosphaeriaceae sp. PMI808]